MRVGTDTWCGSFPTQHTLWLHDKYIELFWKTNKPTFPKSQKYLCMIFQGTRKTSLINLPPSYSSVILLQLIKWALDVIIYIWKWLFGTKWFGPAGQLSSYNSLVCTLQCTYNKNSGWIQAVRKTTEWYVNNKWLQILLSDLKTTLLSAQDYIHSCHCIALCFLTRAP